MRDLGLRMNRWSLKKDVPIQPYIDILMGSMFRLAQSRETAQNNKDAAEDYVANGPKHQSMPATKSE